MNPLDTWQGSIGTPIANARTNPLNTAPPASSTNPLDAGYTAPKPFDATTLGIAYNTVTGLPKATIDVVTNIIHGLFRTGAQAGLTGMQAVGAGLDKLTGQNRLPNMMAPVDTGFAKPIFGEEPLKSYASIISDTADRIRGSSFAQKTGLDKFSIPLAFAGTVGADAFNFYGGEESVIKKIAAETDPSRIFTTLVGAGVDKHIAAKSANELAKISDEGEVKAALDTIKGVQGAQGRAPAAPADTFEKNDVVKITNKITGDSQERVVHNILPDGSGLSASDKISGIPYRVPFDKWDIQLIEKGDPNAKIASQGETFKEIYAREAAEEAAQKNAATPEQLHQALNDTYASAGKGELSYEKPGAVPSYEADQSKVERALGHVKMELEIAEPGYRVISDRTHGSMDSYGVPSTFPQWVPEELRSKKLFDRVLGGLEPGNITFPPARNVKQRRLFQLLLDEVDKATGVDTSAIRESIMRNERSQTAGTPTRVRRSAAGSEATARRGALEPDSRGVNPTHDIGDATAAYKEKFIDAPNANNGLVEISGDEIKKLNGGDYNPDHSARYSEASYKLIEEQLAKGPKKDVVFLGGGPGSGKSELIGQELKDSGFMGLLYDTTLSNYKGITHLLDVAKQAGKNVEIRAILPDLDRARFFTMLRESETGRPVSDADFARGHAGFVETLTKLLANGDIAPEQVHLFDTRGGEAQIPTDVLATLKSAGYTEADILKNHGQATVAAKYETPPPRSKSLQQAGEGTQQANRHLPQGEVSVGRGTQQTAEARAAQEEAAAAAGKRQVVDNIPIHETPAEALEPLAKGPDAASWQSLIKGYMYNAAPEKRVHILDYLATPEFVLEKVGLGKGAEMLHDAQDSYRATLKTEIEKVDAWKERVGSSPYAAQDIFQYLDGREKEMVRQMTPEEHEVAKEIRSYLQDWADRLKLPEDKQISRYITHIFERDFSGKDTFIDPELASIMSEQVAKSVYDPFLQKRLGKPGYVEDVWRALDAYVKRASRKEAMDPALEKLASMAEKLDDSTYKYVKTLSHRVNLRPTELEQSVDSLIKQTPVGYYFTERPTAFLSRSIRQLFFRGTLGLNFSSALRNLSQGANTYAKLGEKYTVIGYAKLLGKLSTGNLDELFHTGVISDQLIQDRTIGVVRKGVQQFDKGLFSLFDLGEKINRGAAYFGAKSQALAKGLSEEQAIKYAKRMVRETQFAFGAVDTPVFLNDDVVKTLTQLQSYNVKQVEFLGRMARQKDFAGLIRYSAASLGFLYTVGRLFGMTAQQLVPTIGIGGAPLTSTVGAIPGLFSNNPQDKAAAVSQMQRNLMTLLPAGAQLRKTIQGAHALEQGRSTTPTGKTRFKVGPQDAAQALFFGPSALPQAQSYYGSLGKKKTPVATGNPLD